jgi:parallel beta-helix repeat protein
MKRIISGMIVVLLLMGMLTLVFNIKPAKAQSGTIYINPDGSLSPATANITTSDKVTYTFTGSNYLPIVVERSNIIINGRDYTLRGSGGGNGFSLTSVNNVTIENVVITNSLYGIYLSYSSGNFLSDNNLTKNAVGIVLYSYTYNNTLFGNDVTANSGDGINLVSSSGNVLSSNKVTANGGYGGIYLYSACDNNTLSSNELSENVNGIILYSSSDNNVLSSNNVTANGVGILL